MIYNDIVNFGRCFSFWLHIIPKLMSFDLQRTAPSKSSTKLAKREQCVFKQSASTNLSEPRTQTQEAEQVEFVIILINV